MEGIVEVEETRCSQEQGEEQGRRGGERNGVVRSGGREERWDRMEPYLRNSSYKGEILQIGVARNERPRPPLKLTQVERRRRNASHFRSPQMRLLFSQ